MSMIVVGRRASRPAVQTVKVDGRYWRLEDGALFRPRFLSAFTLPPDNYLDLAVELGFNGIRTFAGALTWAPQVALTALRRLHGVLDAAAARGLYVELVCLSDTKDGGYDPSEHVRRVASMVEGRPGVLVEVANEPWHGSQSDAVHNWSNLASWGSQFAQPWAEGAPEDDEPLPEQFPLRGSWISLHLNRGRDPWNMVRRVREIENVSASYRRPVMNNEPIGWGEVNQPGRRCADPSIAFCMGALSRGFEVGVVSHAEHGLHSMPPGPVQAECHRALIRGWTALDTVEPLQFQNAGWITSPVKSADFNKVVRAYSFVHRNAGYTVLVGLSGDPRVEWQNGWRSAGISVEMSGCQILKIER